MNITGSMDMVGHTSNVTYGINFDGTEFSGALKLGTQKGTTYAVSNYTGAERTNGFQLDAASGWTGETSSIGGGASHNNMPPYLAVYIWQRTA